MSRAGVGMATEQLLNDVDLRIRFARDPMDAVAQLFLRGCDLSAEEIDLFCWTDAALWFLGDVVEDQRQCEAGSHESGEARRSKNDCTH